MVVLERLLSYWKVVFPDDEQLQSSSLTVLQDEDDAAYKLLDAPFFFDAYIRLPVYSSLSAQTPTLEIYLDNIVVRAYTLSSQASAAASSQLTLADLPEVEDFARLVRFLSSADLPRLTAALTWLFHSDVHFGYLDDGKQASRPHIASFTSCVAILQSELRRLGKHEPNRLSTLKRLLTAELAMLVRLLRACEQVYADADQAQANPDIESILAKGFNTALIPAIRVLAAEHLCYIRNRKARTVSESAVALGHYRTACQVAHYAYVTSRSARYAKYIAQNLLEIANVNVGAERRSVAETLWVDAYVVPYVIGLMRSGEAPFKRLGWTDEVFALPKSPLAYEDIPAYSAEPDFLYSGLAGGLLRRLLPSFTPDLWAASVLLVQHFKDLGTRQRSLDLDRRLPLFAPAEGMKERFPMLQHHPVGWMYLLSEVLLVEHQSGRHPHAGLHAAPETAVWYCRWIDNRLRNVFSETGKQTVRGSHGRQFPHAARHIVQCGAGSGPVIGSAQATWSDTASKWTV